MVVTKDELLNVTTKTKNIHIEDVGEITIRQLTTKEANNIELIKYNYGQQFKLSDKKKAEQNAKLKTIIYGLNVEEEWTIDEINQLPQTIIQQIYNEIKQFNKI